MLYFTRWKALAIILTALAVCLCAVPNFFPETTVKTWPQWAQRHLVLGLDLQGGSHLLLEVDANAVKKDKLDQVRDDVRRVLRENKIVYTALASRADSVEVRITKDSDLPTALSKLRELSQPLGGLLGTSGQRSREVSDAGGGLIRLTVPPAAITDRIRQAVEQSIQIVERRVNELGTVEPLIQRQGNDRILVQVPGLGDPSRLIAILAQATSENVGQPFAIVLDNKVISAPVIREPITGGSGQISGNFTVQAANDLAILLRAGALPAPLTVIEQRTVGPGLGQD